MNGQGWWYVARATGIVSWALLGLSVAFGLVLTTRRTSRRAASWFVDLHRGLSGLGCAMVGAHLTAILADSFTRLDLLDLLVPMRAALTPGALAWGIVALYLLVLVQGTSIAMHRLPHRWWRRVHYTGLGVFWLTTLHGLLAGTDTENVYLRLFALAMVSAVGVLTALRLRAVLGSGHTAGDRLVAATPRPALRS